MCVVCLDDDDVWCFKVLITPKAKIIWDEDRENKLHLILRNGTFYEFEFSWIIDHSNYASFANKYYISVIDKGERWFLLHFLLWFCVHIWFFNENMLVLEFIVKSFYCDKKIAIVTT